MMAVRASILALIASVLMMSAGAQVVVGHVVPLTGVQAPTGNQLSIGARAYIDHVNANGGVAGRRITYLVRDDGYQPDETVRQATELIEKERAVALLTGVGTANGEALIKSGILKSNGVPMIGSRSGASSLHGADNQMIFHLWASYGTEIEKIARQCDTSNLRHMAVVFQDDAFGKDVMKSLENAAAAQRIELVVKAPYERGTTKVEGAVKSVLATASSDSIVIIGVTTAATEFVRQYRQAGGAKQIFGMSIVDPTVMLKALGPELVRGVGLVQVVPNVAASVTPLVQEFRTVFAKYAPKDAVPSAATLQGYISAKVFVEALKKVGGKPSTQSFDKVMEALDVDLGDYVIRYGKNNRVSHATTDIAIFRSDGRLMF